MWGGVQRDAQWRNCSDQLVGVHMQHQVREGVGECGCVDKCGMGWDAARHAFRKERSRAAAGVLEGLDTILLPDDEAGL